MSARAPLVENDRSLGDLLKELTGELQHLMRAEVELAKVELREEAQRATKVGKAFGIAAGLGLLAAFLLSFAMAWGLSEVMAPGLAFLIVGVVYAAVAALVFTRGRDALGGVHPIPDETVETLKEDVAWARARSK